MRVVDTSTLTGFPAAVQTTLCEYDANGNLVRQQREADFNSDGTLDVRITSANTYNSRGQLVKSTSQVDNDANGTIDSASVVTVVYNGVKR